jgi:hypothetical protein
MVYMSSFKDEECQLSPEVSESSKGGNITIGPKLAPYNPTHIDAIHIAIEMLGITNEDIVYDLGCGDGRSVLLIWCQCTGPGT